MINFKSRVFLPVIHVHNLAHAQRNADVAMHNGADGVLLINQGSSHLVTLSAAATIAEDHPDWWVGVNLLGQSDLLTMQALRSTMIRGLWSDNAGVALGLDELAFLSSPLTAWQRGVDEALRAERQRQTILSAKGSWGTKGGIYLAGVAFKYQEDVPKEAWGTAAKLAVLSGIDVVVTSGAATGSAAPAKKLEIMREAIGDHPLGIASGISEENVDQYPWVNVFIVASSILEPGFGDNFNPKKTRSLADRIRKLG